MKYGEQTPSPQAVMANLRLPMSVGRKMRLLVRNYWTRLVRRQTCCGHPGEPGC